MATQAQIIDALSKLDAQTPEHWTSDGQPKVDVVQSLSGDSTITRKHIIDAAPTFTQSNPVLVTESAEPAVSPEQRAEDRDRIDDIRSEVSDLDQRIGEMQKRKVRLVAEADDIISTRPKDHRNAHVGVVKNYLRQQRKNRASKRVPAAKK